MWEIRIRSIPGITPEGREREKGREREENGEREGEREFQENDHSHNETNRQQRRPQECRARNGFEETDCILHLRLDHHHRLRRSRRSSVPRQASPSPIFTSQPGNLVSVRGRNDYHMDAGHHCFGGSRCYHHSHHPHFGAWR